jgi:hypothetical protein
MKSRSLVRAPYIAAIAILTIIAISQALSARAADQAAPVANSALAQRAVDDQIAALRTKLHIADAQMPQWNDLAAAMGENARLVRASIADRAKIHPTTIVDTLYAARLEARAHLERLERVIPVAEALYAVLTDDQRAQADLLFSGSAKSNEGLLDTEK